jgi:hypothetical protein
MTTMPEPAPLPVGPVEEAHVEPPLVEEPADPQALADLAKSAITSPIVTPAPASTIGMDPSHAEWALALQPRDLGEAAKLARAFHASGLYRKKFNSSEAIWTVILLGREHGLSALAALQSLTIIDGKVEMDAALIVAKILRSGLALYFDLVESDDVHAVWETHRRGSKNPVRMSFTVKEAERREIFRVGREGRRETFNGKVSQWQKMPDVMCMWRAATKLGRAVYPDVTRGLYGQGEIRETCLEDVPEMDEVAEKAIAARGRAA